MRISLLLLLLFLLFTPSTSYSVSFSFSHYGTLLSLSHSLASRVANLRASRGDFAGSFRAQSIARKIESFTNLASAVSDLNELLTALNELSRVGSDSEPVAWVGRNYNRILTISWSSFVKLLKVSRHSGPLKEVIEVMQKEVMEGELLRDCLELGTNDLKGLIKILKDIALQYAASTSNRAEL